MASALLQSYIKLTEFLGHALGPDYEVALHDLTDKNRSIIAIANRHVSGRQVGAPLTNVALKILRDGSYEDSDYLIHYRGQSATGKTLRCSTLFIKSGEELIGMLCINYDDSRYRAVSEEILRLCHPDSFVETNFQLDEDHVTELSSGEQEETFQNSIDAVAADAVTRELERAGVSAEQLSADKRLQIIQNLESSGVFLLKGAVTDVAEALGCSKASIYRYISQVKSDKKKEEALC